jgi:metallophosphoesterase (TIGR00282 family)
VVWETKMKVLFIGDVVGKLGRKTVGKVLPNLKKKEKIDLVIANAENLAHGRGASKKVLQELLDYGVDFFTSGPHIFSLPEVFDGEFPLIRPANYPSETPGWGFAALEIKDKKILVVNLAGSEEFIGRSYLEKGKEFENAFEVGEKVISSEGKEADLIIVDFHAELTSEKKALGFFLDGRVTAVLGTHTHIPTADAQILPKGTGYVTDVGMVGAADSVLGVKKEIIIKRLARDARDPFEWVEKGPAVFNSVLLETNPKGSVEEVVRIDREVG